MSISLRQSNNNAKKDKGLCCYRCSNEIPYERINIMLCASCEKKDIEQWDELVEERVQAESLLFQYEQRMHERAERQ